VFYLVTRRRERVTMRNGKPFTYTTRRLAELGAGYIEGARKLPAGSLVVIGG